MSPFPQRLVPPLVRSFLCLAGLWVAAGAASQELELLLDSADSTPRYSFSDPDAWRQHDDGSVELVSESAYRPPQRSPLSIALLDEWLIGSFVLELEVQQTGREYGHRDASIFFGFEDVDRFYYVHLASQPDERAHNVFLVDRADRRPTAPVATAGVDWGLGVWHEVRIERSLEEGTIEVHFNGELTLRSDDATISRGRIGVGSFDDTAHFRNLRIWSRGAERAPPFDWSKAP